MTTLFYQQYWLIGVTSMLLFCQCISSPREEVLSANSAKFERVKFLDYSNQIVTDPLPFYHDLSVRLFWQHSPMGKKVLVTLSPMLILFYMHKVH